MGRKIITAILCVMLCESAACASLSQQQALSDSRIAPYVEATKQNGAGILPGLYVQSGDSKVIEIISVSPEENIYSVSADMWSNDAMFPVYMSLDLSSDVPVLRTYALENEGQYELLAEDFAVVVSEDNRHFWRLVPLRAGEVRCMLPLNDESISDDVPAVEWRDILTAETGTFHIDNNTLILMNNESGDSTATLELNSSGYTLTITLQDGSTIIYQRSKQ